MIIQAKPEHAQGVQELMKLMWCITYPSEKYGISLGMIQLHTSDWDSKTIVDKVAADIKLSPETVQHFVAIENEKIIGNLVVKQDEIKALYVHPDFQNMGMATALLKRVDASKLYVATYNKQAIEFYKKRGYSVAGKSSKKYDFGAVPVYKMIINKISN